MSGRQIEGKGVDFVFPKGKIAPFAYYIYINENGLTGESPGRRIQLRVSIWKVPNEFGDALLR